MNPRIIAISGPLKDSVFPIGDYDLHIGRDRRCDVYLDDPAVSPRHCTISFEYESEKALLMDPRSINGTFINGFCFSVKFLAHGDRIRTGNSIFVYLEGDEAPSLSLTEAEKNWNSPAKAGERVGSYEAAQSIVLDAFLRINASINGVRSVEDIQARVFELLFQVIPADRAAILLAGHNQGHYVSATYADRASQGADPFPIDETITLKVLREGAPAYSTNVICCPLTAFDTRVGAIYAESRPSADEWFTAAHMRLFASISGFTAIALEHARYVGWLEGENRRLNEGFGDRQRGEADRELIDCTQHT